MMANCVIPVGAIVQFDTSGFTAEVGDVLLGKTFASNAQIEEIGAMPNNGSNNVEVVDVDGQAIPAGYYNGNGIAVLSAAEAAKVLAGNIKRNVSILGVTGTYNQFQYANSLSSIFQYSNPRPTGDLEIYAPQCTSISSAFTNCTGITSITFTFGTLNSSLMNACFSGCTGLVSLYGTFSLGAELSSWGMFQNCSSLVNAEVYAPNTNRYALDMVNCGVLSDASIANIINGCYEGGAQTLTMHSNIKTRMNSLMGTITGEAGSRFWTINAGGSISATTFLTSAGGKGWTLA